MKLRHTLIAMAAGISLSLAASAELEYTEELLEHLRGYYGVINGKHKKDIVLIEGEDQRLYIPITEVSEHIDIPQVLPLAKSVYSCSTCIPLDALADYDLIESENVAELSIFPKYQPAQIVSTVSEYRRGDKLPLKYGAGFAMKVDWLYRYDEVDSREDYALDIDLNWGLGRIGNLYASTFVDDEGDTRRGSTYFDTYFDRSMTRMRIGDVVGTSSEFGSSFQMAGIQFKRNYQINPDYEYRPVFKYTTDAQLPGTLSLFLNGQKLKEEEYDRGRLNISHGTSSQAGDQLILVLTDELGNRRVIQDSLFDLSDALAPGEFDFDVSLGELRRDENEYRDWVSSNEFRLGITQHWTQGLTLQATEHYQQASLNTQFSWSRHKISFTGAYAKQELDEDNQSINSGTPAEGSAGTAAYRYLLIDGFNTLQIGLELFETNNFAQFESNPLDLKGATFSLSGRLNQTGYSLRLFEIGELNGGGIGLSQQFGNWSVNFDAQYLETDDYIATLGFRYRPDNRSLPRWRLGHQWERDDSSAAVSASGRFHVADVPVGYQLGVGESYQRDDSAPQYRAGLSVRQPKFNARAIYDETRGNARASARISSGIVYNDGTFSLNARPVNQAYVTVHTGREDIAIKSSGYTLLTDRKGKTTVPTSPFRVSNVAVERSSLAPTDVLSERRRYMRVAAGNFVSTELPVTQRPIVLRIAGKTPDAIELNGKEYPYTALGAYVDNYHLKRRNQLIINGQKVTLKLPEIKDDNLAIFSLNLEKRTFKREQALF